MRVGGGGLCIHTEPMSNVSKRGNYIFTLCVHVKMVITACGSGLILVGCFKWMHGRN